MARLTNVTNATVMHSNGRIWLEVRQDDCGHTHYSVIELNERIASDMTNQLRGVLMEYDSWRDAMEELSNRNQDIEELQ